MNSICISIKEPPLETSNDDFQAPILTKSKKQGTKAFSPPSLPSDLFAPGPSSSSCFSSAGNLDDTLTELFNKPTSSISKKKGANKN
ncbi:hypothetical protein A0J61_02351 [Choanephora cucurbitarum]|uniref:Uncharacterized protein n=1 Tax=Choanephora cucurbitarum TaxID=101091 RepID=A0A1C7NL81_9FUNG|nr:hypothetical protein A0J61_02351 [Choanephora cucurbitarum]